MTSIAIANSCNVWSFWIGGVLGCWSIVFCRSISFNKWYTATFVQSCNSKWQWLLVFDLDSYLGLILILAWMYSTYELDELFQILNSVRDLNLTTTREQHNNNDILVHRPVIALAISNHEAVVAEWSSVLPSTQETVVRSLGGLRCWAVSQ